jgi:hypothetical protein
MIMERPIVAYYFSIVGGSFEIVTGIIIAFRPQFYYPYNLFLAGSPSVFNSLMTGLPGLAILYASWKFLDSSIGVRAWALAVIILSVVSLFGTLWSGIFLIEGLLLPGPFISFTGGVLGLLWKPSVVQSSV